MKRRTLRNDPASPTTKKKNREFQEKLDSTTDQSQSLESQVLTWDGILAAMTFSVPFIVIIAINVQASLAITAVLAAVLLPVSLLSFCLREKLGMPPWVNAPVCALVSTGIAAFAAVYIRSNFAQINDALGMYLYLLAAYPVVGAVFYGKRAKTVKNTVAWALRNIIYFGIFAIIAGTVREVLAYNRFAGLELGFSFKIEAAKMPFFGFIVFAFILAGVAATYRLVSGRLLGANPAEDEEYSSIELELAPGMLQSADLQIEGTVVETDEQRGDKDVL